MLTQTITKLFSLKEVSDIHVLEGRSVWYREAGSMKISDSEVVTREHIFTLLSETRDDAGIDPARLDELISVKGDLDFAARVGSFGLRGNIFKAGNRKLAFALRRLNESIPEMSTMGLPEKVLDLIGRSKGIFLVTGPTGSGKSTTLAALLEHLNQTVQRHIITIEDPVEYQLHDKYCHISQRQIGRDAASFSLALRSALRQDPDILLIGEMRDQDTVKTALDAANTGHLVFATLHTLNARQSIERMTSFFSADEKEWAQQVISSVLLGVLSQVLVPRLDGPGRVLCSELMVNTSAAAQVIRDGNLPRLANIMDTGSGEGHQSLNADLATKVATGAISPEDAMYFAYDPQRLQKELNNEY